MEHAYRLLYPYEDRFSEGQHLLTIVPGGNIENDKVLKPGKDQALFCYPYPQSMPEEKANEFLESPFVWKRTDGSYALVQTWSTRYNDDFRKNFKISQSNPDASKFEMQAVE